MKYVVKVRVQNSLLQFVCMNIFFGTFQLIFRLVRLIYSEKATKFCEIHTILLSVSTVDKSKVEISQNFVAFSEYTNSNLSWHQVKSNWKITQAKIMQNIWMDF